MVVTMDQLREISISDRAAAEQWAVKTLGGEKVETPSVVERWLLN